MICLAKEALKKITDAEAKGKSLKIEAAENAKKIISSADADCEKIIEERITEAKKTVQKIMDDNSGKCRVVLEEAKNKAHHEGEGLKKIIAQNEKKTIDGVVNLLFA